MRDHLAYAGYVLRHKWFVLRACRRTGTPVWRGLIHDLSKLLPSEWNPYRRTFYAPDGSKRYVETLEFNQAWNAHQKRNPHHWQAWVLIMDRGTQVILPMPEKYVREMVADWIGAGLAQGKPDTRSWYEENKGKMLLHSDTRALVEKLLGELFVGKPYWVNGKVPVWP